MRLIELWRTTSFRLALQFLVLFGAASLALFVFLYAQTNGFLRDQVDEWLRREQDGFARLSQEASTERLAARTAVDPTLERPFTLFAADGRRIAGTPLTLPPNRPGQFPLDTPFALDVALGQRIVAFRALANRTSSGDILLIAQDLTDTTRFDDVLVRSLFWGGLSTLGLGLAGAAAAGLDAVRRIEAVTRATERIVAGDLSQRLPVRSRIGDLDRLADVINFMLAEIEHLMREVKGAGDNIAHDLRTPLTRLLAGLERARRTARTVDDYAAGVDDAIGEVRTVLSRFAALLRIAEVESGARRSGFATVDLLTVATDVVEFYEPMAEENDVKLILVRPRTEPRAVAGDASLLFEALSNLVDNAIKHTPSGGRVAVNSEGEDGQPGFQVVDNGIGIPESERGAVLRRFYRIEASRPATGTGLGLALVAAVARLHAMELTIADANPGCRISMTARTPPDGTRP